MDQRNLLDNNLYNIISKCFIHNKRQNVSEITVVYDNWTREKTWTFNPVRCIFDYQEFIGKTKIEAVFYCDRKCSP